MLLNVCLWLLNFPSEAHIYCEYGSDARNVPSCPVPGGVTGLPCLRESQTRISVPRVWGLSVRLQPLAVKNHVSRNVEKKEKTQYLAFAPSKKENYWMCIYIYVCVCVCVCVCWKICRSIYTFRSNVVILLWKKKCSFGFIPTQFPLIQWKFLGLTAASKCEGFP